MIVITTALTSPLFASHESTCSSCMLLIHHVKSCGFAVIPLCVYIYTLIYYFPKIGTENKIRFILMWFCESYTGKSGIKTHHIAAHSWAA